MIQPREKLISRCLQIAADESPRHRALPDARFFWLTSQLIANRTAQERALRPLGLLQVISHLAVAICWAVVIMWKWADIRQWFATPDVGSRLVDAFIGAGNLPLSYLAIVGGLLCITTVVLLHSVMSEE